MSSKAEEQRDQRATRGGPRGGKRPRGKWQQKDSSRGEEPKPKEEQLALEQQASSGSRGNFGGRQQQIYQVKKKPQDKDQPKPQSPQKKRAPADKRPRQVPGGEGSQTKKPNQRQGSPKKKRGGKQGGNPREVKQIPEIPGGWWDDQGFYNLPDGSFYDPDGYFFDQDGFDQYGGYYDSSNNYIPGEGNKHMFEEDYYYDDYRRGYDYSGSKPHYNDYYDEAAYYQERPQKQHRKKKGFEDQMLRDFEAGDEDIEDPEISPQQQKAQDEMYKQYLKGNRPDHYEEEDYDGDSPQKKPKLKYKAKAAKPGKADTKFSKMSEAEHKQKQKERKEESYPKFFPKEEKPSTPPPEDRQSPQQFFYTQNISNLQNINNPLIGSMGSLSLQGSQPPQSYSQFVGPQPGSQPMMQGDQPKTQQFVHSVPMQMGPMGVPMMMNHSPVKMEGSPSKSIFSNPMADKKDSLLNIDAKPFKIGGEAPPMQPPASFAPQQRPLEIDPQLHQYQLQQQQQQQHLLNMQMQQQDILQFQQLQEQQRMVMHLVEGQGLPQ